MELGIPSSSLSYESKAEAYKVIEMVDGREGVGGGNSTYDNNET